MAKYSDTPESLYELGKLYSDRGDFLVAIEKLRMALDLFYEEKEFSGYLRCQNLLLRMYAEREDQEAIDETKERLQDLVLKEEIQLNAKTYYTLGLCSSFKRQNKTALQYLEKSLALALAEDDKENICYAISGLAIVYTALGRLEDALKEIYNLQVFFQVLPQPELELSCQMLNGHILRMMGMYQEAQDVFWRCYDKLRDQKNLYLYINLLYAMGRTYLDAGENDLARTYLNLAKRSIDPENLRHCSRIIEKRLESIQGEDESQYDLVFDSTKKAILEKSKGRVDFRNQFILLDMLRLFVKNPGEVFSKEVLVRRVWKQDYDPSVHDNKIYVTIKRLRKLIEPDYDKPKYIFRAKNGYYLNRETKVLMS